MRILFFSNIPIIKKVHGSYNGGGWISSLIEELCKKTNCTIAVGFFGHTDEKQEYSNLVAYQIATGSILQKAIRKISLLSPFAKKIERNSWKYYEKKLLSVVNDFQPDIIHIFGSEYQFGLIANQTTVPTLLHIQGILNPCYNAFLSPFFSWSVDKINPLAIIKKYKLKKEWELACTREKEVLLRNQNYLGRTIWDKRMTKIFSPQSCYYYGGEILRDIFYKDWPRVLPERLTIISTISAPLYKGLDVILKTALLLKNAFHYDFCWKVYGNVTPKEIERIVGIKHQDVCVEINGVASADDLIFSISNATVFVHPSYIDNSPNSVCEAQMLGVPVIAANVGGLPSIIDDGKTGFLVPANDPYQTAYLIKKLFNNTELNRKIGDNAKKMSRERHNRDNIVQKLVCTYEKIFESCQKGWPNENV